LEVKTDSFVSINATSLSRDPACMTMEKCTTGPECPIGGIRQLRDRHPYDRVAGIRKTTHPEQSRIREITPKLPEIGFPWVISDSHAATAAARYAFSTDDKTGLSHDRLPDPRVREDLRR
jgi:hypothetical protein